MIKNRIEAVRDIMEREGIDVYVVCTGDYHMSEYASEYFAQREFLSGFTGSAGTLVVAKDTSALFTDGRYFVQALKQLEGSGIELMRMGCEGVPELVDFCKGILPFNGTLGMDGRTVSAGLGKKFETEADKKNAAINYTFNAVDEIWQERPEFPKSSAYKVEAGEDICSKLKRLRVKMEQMQVKSHIIASLDDICWLLNIRGADVKCNPVIMCYGIIFEDKMYLYADEDRFADDLKKEFYNAGVEIRRYESIYDDCKSLAGSVLVDEKRMNYALYRVLCENEAVKVILSQNPTVLMKAVKNEEELRNLRAVHIEDGLAVMKFIYRIKKTLADGGSLTEAQAAELLDKERAKIADYTDVSFDTICAYGANAAMMHYHAVDNNCSVLKPEGMLLVDSGGQYFRGTTDVTRTFALGNVTQEMKRNYTLTLKGMLALADAHFLKGCTGFNLDILARQYLWAEGIDYRCGTGHGVGYMLNVHESPNGFRWRHMPGVNDLCALEPGMVTSDEPGVYKDGEYGIRIENEIVCVEDFENEYGTFLKFEMLTCVPFDLELVDEKILENIDKQRLNRYHEWVYNKLKVFVSGRELEFLENATRSI